MPPFPILAKKLTLTAQELSFDPQDIENCSIETLEKTLVTLKQQYHKLAKKAHPDKKGSSEVFADLNNAYEEAVKYVQKLIEKKQNRKDAFDPSQFINISAVQLFVLKKLEMNLNDFIRIVEKCDQQLKQDFAWSIDRIADAAYEDYLERMKSTITIQRYLNYVQEFKKVRTNYLNAYQRAVSTALELYKSMHTQNALLSILLFPINKILFHWKEESINEALQDISSKLNKTKPLTYENWLRQSKSAHTPIQVNEVQDKNAFLASSLKTPEKKAYEQNYFLLAKTLCNRHFHNQDLVIQVKNKTCTPREALSSLCFSLFQSPSKQATSISEENEARTSYVY